MNLVGDVGVADLLGREPVPPNEALLARCVTGRRVLVTGAGGSIGSELCRQLIELAPHTLVLVEQSEYPLFRIETELREIAERRSLEVVLLPLLGDVGDRRRMEEVVGGDAVQTIYHTAAYKHVPIVERNPLEGIRNNVLGTQVLADVAERHRVRDFVLISTDKAVRPANVMGASKRLAEMVLQAMANSAATTFSMVRFGNVLGSSGSVVPVFMEQIAKGGPVTVTHAEAKRYFMTVGEAVQLVIQAGAMARGGDLFVLDMGEPVRIIDLARQMIQRSGLTVRDPEHPGGDIEIRLIGLRPGEKLFEELLLGAGVSCTEHPKILRAREEFPSPAELDQRLAALHRAVAAGRTAAALDILRRVVGGSWTADPPADAAAAPAQAGTMACRPLPEP